MNELLRVSEIPDYDQALNGVQFENRQSIHRVAAAVDYSSETVRLAAAADAQLLIVHHGMFWGGLRPYVAVERDRLGVLFERDLAVYAAHLPLDVHAEIGNNTLLAKTLGLTPAGVFARFRTIEVGVSGVDDVATDELLSRAIDFARQHGGTATATPFPSGHRTRRWGICTGAGADSRNVREAIDRGLDTIVVGEGPHHTAVEARDAGLVIIYAGHYATETLGVRALADRCAERFSLVSIFLPAPTGL